MLQVIIILLSLSLTQVSTAQDIEIEKQLQILNRREVLRATPNR